mgnify:CR=1 FL=1
MEQTNIMMTTELGEFSKAMAAAQAEMGNATKSCDNPFFKSKYADLAEVLDTVKAALNKHGIAVVQLPGMSGQGWAEVTTMLTHSSGQYLGSTLRIPVSKNDPQGAGSAITYARRYALAAICGIAQEDDDGNTASGKRQAPQDSERTALLENISANMKKKRVSAKAMMEFANQAIGKPSTKDMTNAELKQIAQWLEDYAQV